MESPPTGTVTFLFTDIEGSTRRWQDDAEAMRVLLVEHDAILRDVIDKRHGHLFKHTGDGVAAVFASAADAVSAAVDAQERLHDVLPVRMGLHTGEAELRDGDYFGSTLNRCARLMGVAHGGQIVHRHTGVATSGTHPVMMIRAFGSRRGAVLRGRQTDRRLSRCRDCRSAVLQPSRSSNCPSRRVPS